MNAVRLKALVVKKAGLKKLLLQPDATETIVQSLSRLARTEAQVPATLDAVLNKLLETSNRTQEEQQASSSLASGTQIRVTPDLVQEAIRLLNEQDGTCARSKNDIASHVHLINVFDVPKFKYNIASKTFARFSPSLPTSKCSPVIQV